MASIPANLIEEVHDDSARQSEAEWVDDIELNNQEEAASSEVELAEPELLDAAAQLRELRSLRRSIQVAQQEMTEQMNALNKTTRESRAERVLAQKALAERPAAPKVKRERAEIIKPTWASKDPETTAQKKLKASISGCLDRSICTTQQKRSALFDSLNNHRKV